MGEETRGEEEEEEGGRDQGSLGAFIYSTVEVGLNVIFIIPSFTPRKV